MKFDDHKQASAWFETLYKTHFLNADKIPWAEMKADEHLEDYINNNNSHGKALVVGCGLGDDAVALCLAGFDVTAIDISSSAISWCKERFNEYDKENYDTGFGIEFKVQDIFELPDEMKEAYDFVFESRTIQSLPLIFRDKIITAISSLLKPKGRLLLIANGKLEGDVHQGPPWPLEQNEVKLFGMKGMSELEFSIVEDKSKISRLKFKALYQKD